MKIKIVAQEMDSLIVTDGFAILQMNASKMPSTARGMSLRLDQGVYVLGRTTLLLGEVVVGSTVYVRGKVENQVVVRENAPQK